MILLNAYKVFETLQARKNQDLNKKNEQKNKIIVGF
jgi:hypothetical protein